MIKKIGGWGNFIFLCIFIFILSYSGITKYNRWHKSLFVKGVSLGVKRGIRGHYLLYYSFKIGENYFEGSVSDNICKVCNCCDVNHIVIVRYQSGNPENNDLVVELPQGAKFE